MQEVGNVIVKRFVASSVGGEMTRVQVEEAKDLCRNQAEIGEEESDSTGRED